jgi:tRNA-specific 2-thiouridylase
MKKKVMVALSGGKDSTAACLLLQQQGYDVTAATMSIGKSDDAQTLEKLMNLTEFLKIPLQVIDMRAAFADIVKKYFLDSYQAGETPNPCVICNRFIKFGLFLDQLLAANHDVSFATGHYADICRIGNDYFLVEPKDLRKSQIYFLAMINRQIMPRLIFPLADYKVEDVRLMVKGYPLVNRIESQDFCFIEKQALADYLKDHLAEKFIPGDICNIKGEKIGSHQGVLNYTIGQRRGFGLAFDRKLYVISKDISKNCITLGDYSDLSALNLTVSQTVFWRTIFPGEELRVKVRYQTRAALIRITEVTTDAIHAVPLEPIQAVTPGQTAVFYQQNMIVAAGIIAYV